MSTSRITFPYATKLSNLADGTEQHDAIALVQLDARFTTTGEPGKAPVLGTDGKLPGTIIPASAGLGTVTSVNGIEPDSNGNVPLSLSATETGTLAERDALVNPADATIYIVSGDANPNNDGKVFIYSTTAEDWFEVSFMDEAALDARYLRSDEPISTDNNITVSGGATVTGLPLPVNPTDAASRAYVDSKNFLSELGDVDLQGLSDGQTIVWNGSVWTPENLPTDGGGTGPIGPITASDVDFDPIDAFPLTAMNVQDALEQAAGLIDGKLNISGGVVTGALSVQDPTAIKHAANKEYVDGKTDNKLPLAGGTLTGELTLDADPTDDLHAATKQYVDSEVAALSIGDYLPLAGGEMTGTLVLDADPVNSMEAATKGYVDANVATLTSSIDDKLPLSGGTLTGELTLDADPTDDLHAATKGYVDDQFATLPATTAADANRSPVLDGDGKLDVSTMPGGLVKSVNGIEPDVDGAVVINLQATVTGTLDERDALVDPADGTLFIVVGDPVLANNGKAYIWSDSAADWVELAPADQASNDARYVNVDGDDMTGYLTMTNNGTVVTRDPVIGNEVATKDYVDNGLAAKLNTTGGTVTGQITSTELVPSAMGHLTTKFYVDTVVATSVSKSGDTMIGPLTLSGAPGAPLQAATKGYVDANVAALNTSINAKLNTTGGTLSGSLTLPADVPNSPTHAATQAYVDGKVSTEISSAIGSLELSASEIGFTPTGNLVATNVQGAVTEVHTEIGVVNSNKVAKAGDIMTGRLTLSAGPTAPLHAATKQYVDDAVAGATGTGPSTADNITYDSTGTALDSTTVQNAITELDNKKVSIAGDTMTGRLTLSGVPTAPLHAATKGYVDGITTPLVTNVANITNELNALKSDAVKSVNGALPDLGGDVAIALTRTYTGPLNQRPGIVPNPQDGDLYIVSANLVDPDKNGTTFIFSDAANNWLEITSTQTTEGDLRYVRKGGDSMTGDLDMTGSKVINVEAPAAPGDATNKQYVDGTISSSIGVAMNGYVSKTVDNIMTSNIRTNNPAKPGTYLETDARFGSFDSYEGKVPGSAYAFTSMYGATLEQQYRDASGDTLSGVYIFSKAGGSTIDVEGAYAGQYAPTTSITANAITITDAAGNAVTQTLPQQVTTKKYVDDTIDDRITAASGDYISRTEDNVMTASIRMSYDPQAGEYIEMLRWGEIKVYEGKVPGSAYNISRTAGAAITLEHRDSYNNTISGVYMEARTDNAGGSTITVKRDVFTTGEYSKSQINTGTIELTNAAGDPTIPTSPFEVTTKAYVDSLTGSVSNDLADTNNALSALSNSVVKKVNGILPAPDGNVGISLSRTYTGPLNQRPGIVPTPADGDVYIVSGDLVQPENNGKTFIWSDSSSQWIEVVNPGAAAADARYLQIDGSTPMTGELDMNDNVITNVGYPLALTDAAHKGYVNELIQNTAANLRDEIADYLPKTGGTLTGALTLSADPTNVLHATTKQYVDKLVGVTEYVFVTRTTNFTVNAVTDLIFNRKIEGSGDLSSTYNTTTGVFTLQAGIPYELFAAPSFSEWTVESDYIFYEWVNAATNTPLINNFQGAGFGVPVNSSRNIAPSPVASIAYTPVTTMGVKLRVTSFGANGTMEFRPGGSSAYVRQLGNNALTGNVTIGGGATSTSSTTGALRVNGGLGVSGNTFIGGDLRFDNTTNFPANVLGVNFGDAFGVMPTSIALSHSQSTIKFYDNSPSTSNYSWGMGVGTDTSDNTSWLWSSTNRGPGTTTGGYRWYGRGSKLMELHAANGLTVTGTVTAANVINQTALDYISVAFSAPHTLLTAANATVPFNLVNSISGQITHNAGVFTLKANKTYNLMAGLGGNAERTGYAYYAWMTAANTLVAGSSVGGIIGVGSTTTRDGVNNTAQCIFTPTVDTAVSLKTFNATSPVILQPAVIGTAWSSAWATIIQLR